MGGVMTPQTNTGAFPATMTVLQLGWDPLLHGYLNGPLHRLGLWSNYGVTQTGLNTLTGTVQ
jgi:hypothetical protein